MPCRAVTLAALCVLVSSFAHAASPPPVEVTTCGQIVPKNRDAILTTDLVCPTDPGSFGVGLKGGAKLDLQGHTITGAIAGVACLPVQCDGVWCAPTRRSARCHVSNGTIAGARYEGITARSVVVRNVTFTDNRAYDVLTLDKADVYDSHFQAAAGDDSVTAVQANNRVRLFDSTVVGGYVSAGKRIDLRSSSVTNGFTVGVSARDVRLYGSTVTGNDLDPRCGTEVACADIISERMPKLDAASTCERSRRPAGGGEPIVTWGVCALD